VAPFTWLTRKDQPFSGGTKTDNAFQSLKAYFMIIPLLIHVDLSKPFVLETKVSYFVDPSANDPISYTNMFPSSN
jgi:hypothetical protein